jgi:hypothetical protein
MYYCLRIVHCLCNTATGQGSIAAANKSVPIKMDVCVYIYSAYNHERATAPKCRESHPRDRGPAQQ